jgi:hypothetical protein
MYNTRICVQKFHHDPRVRLNDLSMAIFLRGSLWNHGDTITVSFLPIIEELRPTWYPLEEVKNSLSTEQLDLEIRARKLSYPEAVKLVVREAIAPIVSKLNIQFVDYDGMVRIRFDKTGGSSSLIGTACLQSTEDHTITFGWMDVGTIIHEFSHALGMLHEHQNPSGGIKWNKDAVYAWAAETQGWDRETTQENILNTYSYNQITGSTYDPESVMLYFFPSTLTLDGTEVKQNLRYSKTDIEWLEKNYGDTSNDVKKPEPQQKKMLVKWWVYLIVAVIILILFLI